MTQNEIRAAFAVIVNNSTEQHIKDYALECFHRVPVEYPKPDLSPESLQIIAEAKARAC